jgi:hypothetical protein
MCDLLGNFLIRATHEAHWRLSIKGSLATWRQDASSLRLELAQSPNTSVEATLFAPTGSNVRDLTIYTNCLYMTIEGDSSLTVYGDAYFETTHGSVNANLENLSFIKSRSRAITTDNPKRHFATYSNLAYKFNIDTRYRLLIWSIWGALDCKIYQKVSLQDPVSIKTFS